MLRKVIRELILEAINLQLRSRLQPAQRITMLPKELDISKAGPFSQPNMSKPALKPSGIWYSFGTAWADFAEDESFLRDKYQESEYVYEILGVQTTDLDNPNPNKVLVLKTREEAKAFSEKYNIKRTRRYIFAPWDKIAKDFGGIEIASNDALDSYFGGWDVVSGCVWNLSTLQTKQLQGPTAASKKLEDMDEQFIEDVVEWLYWADNEWMEDSLLQGDYNLGENIDDAENIYEAIAGIMEEMGVYEIVSSIKSSMIRTDNMDPISRLKWYIHLKTGWSPVAWGTSLGTDDQLKANFERRHPDESPYKVLDKIFESVTKFYNDPRVYRLSGNRSFELEYQNY